MFCDSNIIAAKHCSRGPDYILQGVPKVHLHFVFWHFVKVGDVLKNSGNLLHDSYKNFILKFHVVAK